MAKHHLDWEELKKLLQGRSVASHAVDVFVGYSDGCNFYQKKGECTLYVIILKVAHSYIASHDLIINSSGKIGYQSCVYAAAMHTELEFSTPRAVRVVNRQP